jgi:hypothetical protein
LWYHQTVAIVVIIVLALAIIVSVIIDVHVVVVFVVVFVVVAVVLNDCCLSFSLFLLHKITDKKLFFRPNFFFLRS